MAPLAMSVGDPGARVTAYDPAVGLCGGRLGPLLRPVGGWWILGVVGAGAGVTRVLSVCRAVGRGGVVVAWFGVTGNRG